LQHELSGLWDQNGRDFFSMLTVAPSHIAQSEVHRTPLPADLAIVIPTYNEAANVPILIERLEVALLGHAWEVIFVDDDSPDQTAEIAQRIGRAKPHVRCIHRIGRRGLSSAVIEGVLSANTPYVAVMDADLQHDENVLVAMLRALENREADLVVGSRYVSGGSVGDWPTYRRLISRAATAMSSLVTGARLSDPMSGFFMLQRDLFIAHSRTLSGNGYKILFDFLTSAPRHLRVAELPYVFRPRVNGESKLNAGVMVDHVILLLSKSIGRIVPIDLLTFGMSLGFGVLAHLALLSCLLSWFAFNTAQSLASLLVLCTKYLVTVTTDGRKPTVRSLSVGFFLFLATASAGLLANLTLATLIYANTHNWWMAGGIGAAMGTVWDHLYRLALTSRMRR
jgi:dolichol-phosphate mannosyltransferase